MRDDVYLLPVDLVEPVATMQLPALGAVLTVFAHVLSRDRFFRLIC